MAPHHITSVAFLALFLAASMACTSATTPHTPEQCADTLAPQPTPQTLSLLFVGDLMQHQSQIDAARRGNGFSYEASFQQVQTEIQKADLAVGNLECALGGMPYTGYPCFSAPDTFLHALHRAGFRLLSTANNHCLDRGSKGARRTIALLDSLGFHHLGTYADSASRWRNHPLLVEQKGFRLAFLAYTYATNGIKATPPLCVNYIDRERMRRDIKRAKSMQPDAIIALMHWGNEYQDLPSAEQKNLSQFLFQQGVTHIIGSHPHVVQPILVHTDSLSQQRHLLVYSLGNFISGMSAPRTDGGLMVRMTLEKTNGNTCLKHTDYSLVWTCRPAHHPQKDYALVPPSKVDSLPPSAAYLMRRFLKHARQLLQKHNRGIQEKEF